jgi:hypothetical protein
MSLTVTAETNPIVVTGTATTSEEIKNDLSRIRVVYWYKPTTAGHLLNLTDKDGNVILPLECESNGVSLWRALYDLPVDGIFCDDMDSGTLYNHFYKAFDHQWKLNQYYRTQYDEDIEYYVGYRPEEDYPLAFNMTFPLLLPRITNMLSRMLEQLYQAPTHDLVSARPKKRADVDRAPRVSALLNHQLESLNDVDMMGGSYMFNYEWMNNALSWGKGIAKAYWKKEERISPLRKYQPVPVFDGDQFLGIGFESYFSQEEQIVYDAPYAEVLHNKVFVPHPFYKSIQKMPFVFCVYKKSVDYIKDMQRKGVFRNVKELGWNSQKGELGVGAGDLTYETLNKSIEMEGSYYDTHYASDRISPEVEIIEGYGRYIFPEDNAPYEVGSGVKIKGKESDAKIIIGNHKVVLHLEKWNYGYKPFFDIGAYRHPELFWDLGVIRLGKGIQEQYDTLANSLSGCSSIR